MSGQLSVPHGAFASNLPFQSGKTFGPGLTPAGQGNQFQQQVTYFGQPPRNYSQDDYAGFSLQNKILPHAWKDAAEAKVLEVIIEKVTEKDSWWLTTCAPWVKWEGNHKYGEKIRFSTEYLDEVPEQGVVRNVSQTYEKWSASLVRRGLGFMMEDGFAMTEKGKFDYVCHTTQIAEATKRTAIFTLILTLMSSRYANDWYELFGLPRNRRQLDRLFEQECQMFGCLSKAGGFQILQHQAEEIMSFRAVTPTHYVFPVGTVRQYAHSHKAEEAYFLRGPQGVANQNSETGGINSVAKWPIYECARMSLGDKTNPVDLFERERAIGEMFSFDHRPHQDIPVEDYVSKLMNLTLLNHETDMMEEISFPDWLDNCPLFYQDGTLSQEVGEPFFRAKAGANGTFGEFIDNTDKQGKFWASVKHRLDDAKVDNVGFFVEAMGHAVAGRDRRPGDPAPPPGGRPNAVNSAIERAITESIASAVDEDAPSREAYLDDLKRNVERYSERAADTQSFIDAYAAESPVALVSTRLTPDQYGSLAIQLIERNEPNVIERFVNRLNRATGGGALAPNNAAPAPGDDEVVAAVDLRLLLSAVMSEVDANGQAHPALNVLTTNAGGVGPIHRRAQALAPRSEGGVFYKSAMTKLSDRAVGEPARENRTDAIMSIVSRIAVISTAIPDSVFSAQQTTRKAFLKWISDGIAFDDTLSSRDTARMVGVNVERNLSAVDTWIALLGAFALGLRFDMRSIVTPVVFRGVFKGTWVEKLKAFPVASLTKSMFQFFLKHDVWFPFEGMGFRPYITWSMTSGMLLRAGAETCEVGYNAHDFKLSADGARKMLHGNMTLYMGPVVHEPRNILQLLNVGVRSYVTGGGIGFWRPFDRRHVEALEAGDIPYNAGVFAVPTYPGERTRGRCIDITGKFPPGFQQDEPADAPLHYAMARECTEVYQWTLPSDDRYIPVEMQESEKLRNTRVFRGHCFRPTVDKVRGIDAQGYEVTGNGHFNYSYSGAVLDRQNSVQRARPEDRAAKLLLSA